MPKKKFFYGWIVALGACVAGGMIGPLIAGAFFDLRGVYGAAYLLFALITAVCCCVLLLLCRDETCRYKQS